MGSLSYAGRILVARPDISDPNFDITITMVIEHTEEGALGLVLNRPSEVAVQETFAEWSEMVVDPPTVFAGGPVGIGSVIALGRSDQVDGELVHNMHPVDLQQQPSLVAGSGVEQVRIFGGYAGWGPGQLEGELANKGWWVVDGSADDVFSSQPSRLWAEVMGRQKGELAWYAHYPLDPSAN